MRRLLPGLLALVLLGAIAAAFVFSQPRKVAAPRVRMPIVVHRDNLYSEAGAGHFSRAVAGMPARIYVPNIRSDDVYVIDPGSLKVIGHFPTGRNPQHVVPSYDLKTLWVAGSAAPGKGKTFLMPIDPRTSVPGKAIPVADAYNLYFTPGGEFAMDIAEEERRIEFRDPHTMAYRWTLNLPHCKGLNHGDFSIDGRFAIFSCEFGGRLMKIDLVSRRVVAETTLPQPSMPQDVRIAPDGKTFFVADMMQDGVFVVDDALRNVGFIHTGIGTHGLMVSRDGTKLYVANRGSHVVLAKPHGPGSVSVIDFATRRVIATWPVPGGGSPDMGNVSADGRYLWMSGRFDNVIYRVDARTGAFVSIPVGKEPHGLCVWPQPGRYSLGHTGIMR